jgi:DNA-binding transcriptional LysR family regulator
MHDLNDMYLFAKVVEQGGYSAAARHLGMQVSRLSRRINDLETSLGVRLLNRTTRKISLTDIGQTFYQHCIALVAAIPSTVPGPSRRDWCG